MSKILADFANTTIKPLIPIGAPTCYTPYSGEANCPESAQRSVTIPLPLASDD